MYGQSANTVGVNRTSAMEQKDAYAAQAAQKNAALGQSEPYRSSAGKVQEIAERFEYLERLSHRLAAITDRACGMQPPPPMTTGAGTIAPNPDCLDAKLTLISHAMCGLCDQFETSINRLDTFV